MPMFKTSQGKIQDVKESDPKKKQGSKDSIASIRNFDPKPPQSKVVKDGK